MIPNIKTIPFDGVYIKHSPDETVLGYSTVPQQKRAEFLFKLELSKGKTEFEISQKPLFKKCGPMIDVSNGAVLKPEAVCDMLDQCATLGLNMAMLYMVDVYKLKEYPKFGYMRGGYTIEQLKQIDDYADSIGIELIPCIQTLGHFGTYTGWGEVPADSATVLLPGNEEVYKFIECEIAAMRKAFRSNTIHIGMDEAVGLGTGRYLLENGYEDSRSILNKHLARVLQITEKYGYAPMMWSDMFYTGTDSNAYYEDDVVIPQEAIDGAPAGVNLMFWDYYHTYYSYYDKKFIQQERFPNNPSSFAGGIWTWDGFAPNFKYTLESTLPALKAAADHNIDFVLATMWGGSTVEADLTAAASCFAIYSEYCYRGESCTKEDIYDAAKALTGENKEYLEAISDFWCGYDGAVRIGTGLMYCDLLLDTFCRDIDFDDVIRRYEHSLQIIAKYPENARHDYYTALFSAALGKAKILKDLRPAYLNGNKGYLQYVASKEIERLRIAYKLYYAEYRRIRRETCNPFGFECVPIRYGGMDARLEDVQQILFDYLDGTLKTIEELDCPRESSINVTWRGFGFYTKVMHGL